MCTENDTGLGDFARESFSQVVQLQGASSKI